MGGEGTASVLVWSHCIWGKRWRALRTEVALALHTLKPQVRISATEHLLLEKNAFSEKIVFPEEKTSGCLDSGQYKA